MGTGGLNDVPLLSLLNKKIKKPVRTIVKGPSELEWGGGRIGNRPLRGIEVKPCH